METRPRGTPNGMPFWAQPYSLGPRTTLLADAYDVEAAARRRTRWGQTGWQRPAYR